jgi:hypothetical protein
VLGGTPSRKLWGDTSMHDAHLPANDRQMTTIAAVALAHATATTWARTVAAPRGTFVPGRTALGSSPERAAASWRRLVGARAPTPADVSPRSQLILDSAAVTRLTGHSKERHGPFEHRRLLVSHL